MTEDKKTEKKELLVKILVPALIVVVIIIIWAVKTNSASDPVYEQVVDNPDFALEITSVDVDAMSKYNLPIIIDFGADSCVPCKEMAPVLKALNAEMQNKAIIKFVDVWKNPDAMGDFPIQVIPTQVFINADGSPYVPGDNLGIQFDLYSYKDTGEHAYTVHQGGLTEKQIRTILYDMGVKK